MLTIISRCLAGLACLLISDLAVGFHGAGTSFSITQNGYPVLELYGANDEFRYRLNDDWLLGLSLGISPKDLINGHDGFSMASRWLPHFNTHRLLELSQSKPFAALPRGRIRWYWTVGTFSDGLALGEPRSESWDMKSDFISQFSLQTKTGFIVPFGERWLLGGALTINRTLNPRDLDTAATAGVRHRGGAGAYLGLELKY